ncbi:hypothetical protein HDIA_2098 [Hartmannibacter diazotrophicus]|uniref:DUF2147 domain-containing protein n=1 Tax=Hartmannibacter diazotrophicus TaxID=1482074 RepID=A0A2C9D646_9HYPH|nr:DUF2147 domain-containing protein [Hartmannibacter diazotrophicus]SON55639.1 hypothetical protein HDIA_2098 [Hartmannibacter diazotrophicus]
MLRWTVVSAMAIIVAGSAQARSVDPDFSGVWMRGDGNARVKIAACGQDICATNVWVGDTSKGEEVGDRLVLDVAPQSASTLKGKAYDVKRDLTYAITITVRDRTMKTRGCVLLGIVCKTASWTRLGDAY